MKTTLSFSGVIVCLICLFLLVPIAGAPETEDDEKGRPYTNDVGTYFRKLLRMKNVDLHRDCWTTYAIRCRLSGKSDIKQSVMCCRPSLLNIIKEHKPVVILLMGQPPLVSLVKHLWRDDVGSINRWRGLLIPDTVYNTWIAPLDNPTLVARKAKKNVPLTNYFKKTLFAALAKKKKPYTQIPDYLSQVHVITKPAKAARMIRGIRKTGLPIAFDYEGNCLKPETPGAKLVSCSVCYGGEHTIAYPMRGEAVQATADLLKSKCLKIAANIKFEHRWTRYMLKTRVRNWTWDTMLAAHALDNRPGITSLKFGVFAMLGMGSYDDHIKPFLRQKGKMRLNRIDEIDERDLLLYNGLDSLYEYKLAQLQMPLFGRDAI